MDEWLKQLGVNSPQAGLIVGLLAGVLAAVVLAWLASPRSGPGCSPWSKT
jgi:hypothetical protein